MTTETTVRAPRLTENRLADLDEAVDALDKEIAYLSEAVQEWPTAHAMRTKLQDKHDKLKRARAWIAGKVEAERAHRGDA